MTKFSTRKSLQQHVRKLARLLILCWMLVPFCLTAQTDSVKRALQNQQLEFKGLSDTLRLNTLLGLGDYYQYFDPDSAIYFHTAALAAADSVSQRLPDVSLSVRVVFELKKAVALKGVGWDYFSIGDFATSEIYFQKALDQVEKQLVLSDQGIYPHILWRGKKLKAAVLANTAVLLSAKGDHGEAIKLSREALAIEKEIGLDRKQSFVLANMGLYYDRMGNYPMALDCYFNALKIDEEQGNLYGQAANLGNIGNLYMSLQEYDKALTYLQRSIEINIEMGDKVGEAINLSNIGLIYQSQENYEKALEYFKHALQIDIDLDIKAGQCVILGNIGVIYELMDDEKTADEYHQKALEISIEIGDVPSQAYELGNLGILKRKYGKYGEAEKFLKQALQITYEVEELDGMSSYHQQLSMLYEETGKPQLALDNYKKYILYRDSIYNDDLTRKSVEKEMQFEFSKQTAEDSVAFAKQKEIDSIQIAKQDADLKARRNQQYGLTGGLFLVLIFAVFMYNRFKVTKKQKGIIEHQKQEVEQQKHLVDEKQKEIIDSINYARRIQAAILPPVHLVKKMLPQSFVLYKPKDIVAGDFYWLETGASTGSVIVPSGNLNRADLSQADGVPIILVAAADCTGHGVPGAMVSVVCNNALNRAVREYQLTEPGKILDKTREIVISEFEKSAEEVKDGMDISLCSLVRQNEGEGGLSSLTLSWAGANNPLWILRNGASEIEEIKADKQPVGKFAEAKPFQTHQLQLNPADQIYIFSDGFQDQFGGDKGKKFKASKLKELIVTLSTLPMQDQCTALENAFEQWKGSLEQLDDVCLIGIRI